MRKFIFILIISVVTDIYILSIEMTDYPMKLVKEFNVGYKYDEIGYEIFPSPGLNEGPVGMVISSDGVIYIIDSKNNRLVTLDQSYNIDNEYPLKGYLLGSINPILINDIIYSIENKYSLNCTSLKGEPLLNLDLYDSKNEIQSFLYLNNYYIQFIWKKGSLKMSSIRNPNPDIVLKLESFNNDETSRDLISREKELERLSVDNFKRLFLDDKLVTAKYKDFHHYWGIEENELLQFYLEFLGEDSFGNVYWTNSYNIAKFNSEGKLIDLFSADFSKLEYNRNECELSYAVHPNGDIYILLFYLVKKNADIEDGNVYVENLYSRIISNEVCNLYKIVK